MRGWGRSTCAGSGRRVRLTPAAQLLLRHADLLFAQLEMA